MAPGSNSFMMSLSDTRLYLAEFEILTVTRNSKIIPNYFDTKNSEAEQNAVKVSLKYPETW